MQTQWDKIAQEMYCKDPWIGMNGQSHKGLHVQSWMSFQDCIKLHKVTIFPADATKKQHFYMQQTVQRRNGGNISVGHYHSRWAIP